MNITGKLTITAAGFRLRQTQEDLSTLFRMGCCLRVLYISCSICIGSRSIQMYASTLPPPKKNPIKDADYKFRIIIRSYPLDEIERVLLENISISNSLTIPKDQLNSFYGGIFSRLF